LKYSIPAAKGLSSVWTTAHCMQSNVSWWVHSANPACLIQAEYKHLEVYREKSNRIKHELSCYFWKRTWGLLLMSSSGWDCQFRWSWPCY